LKELDSGLGFITISSGLSIPNWTIRTLATSAGENGNRISMSRITRKNFCKD